MKTASRCRNFHFHEKHETPAVPCADERAASSDDTLGKIFSKATGVLGKPCGWFPSDGEKIQVEKDFYLS